MYLNCTAVVRYQKPIGFLSKELSSKFSKTNFTLAGKRTPFFYVQMEALLKVIGILDKCIS